MNTIGIDEVTALAAIAGPQDPRRDDHCHLAANQIGRQCWHSIVLVLGRPVFDCDVPTLDIASFLQALAECSHQVRSAFRSMSS